jgi:DNA invertase Pin-like site-specific DNA recombinase
MRAALYCRVSTADQNPANQELELRKACEGQNWDIQAVYTDVISGAKSKRPALDKLMEAVRNDEVDVICAWDVSRLGRSLQHLIALLSDIHAKDVDLYLHQQGIDTTSPSGKA